MRIGTKISTARVVSERDVIQLMKEDALELLM
jgi:hypothetical protein